jgi:hypothetical protein
MFYLDWDSNAIVWCFRNILLQVKHSLTICRERERFLVQVPLICVACFAEVKPYKRVNRIETTQTEFQFGAGSRCTGT